MYKVVIGIPTTEMARQAKFYDFFFALDKPEGTTISLAHGQSPAANRNHIIEQALMADATHIFFVDDDVLIPENALKKLLAHDKDIVSGLYLMRNFPHQPIAMNVALSDGRNRFMYLKPGMKGLVEATNFGLGCCLIKTDVFKKMDKPWITIGQMDPELWNDDIDFFNRARDRHNYQLWLDLSICCGHMCTVTVWPQYREDDNIWTTVYDSQGSGNAAFYAATPEQVVGFEEFEKIKRDNAHLITKDLS